MGLKRVMVSKLGPMALTMKDTGKITNSVDWANFGTKKVTCMRETGKTAKPMDMGSTLQSRVLNILETGKKTSRAVWGSRFGQRARGMKEILLIA